MIQKKRTVDFQELTVFRAIVAAGSLSAAAERLDIAKSAVSTRLQRLESRLGVRLLNRSARRLELTREGERLLPRIDSLLDEAERLGEEAGEEVTRPSGVVHIAASPEFGQIVAERLLPVLAERQPDIRLVMKLAYDMEDLQASTFDLAFRLGHVYDDRLVARTLGQFHRALYASPDWLAAHAPERPEDLERMPCLVFSATETDRTWTLVHPSQGTRPVEVRGRIAVHGFTALRALAEAGHGIAYLPDFVGDRAVRAGRLQRCLPEWRSQPTAAWLTYRFGNQRIGRIRAVIGLAQEVLPDALVEDHAG